MVEIPDSLLPLVVRAIDMALWMDADSDAPLDEKPFTDAEYAALHDFKEANNG